MDFTQTGLSTSPIYALPAILFSAVSNRLEKQLHCRHDNCHIGPPSYDLHKLSDILMYHASES